MSQRLLAASPRLKYAGGVAAVLAAAYMYHSHSRKPASTKQKERKATQIVTQKEVNQSMSKLMKHLYSIGGNKLVGVACLAIVKVFLFNYQGRLQGQLFETAFLKRVPEFFRILVRNIGICVATSAVESTRQYLLDSLAIQWRGWVTEMLHAKYFSRMAYYQMSYVDRRIADAETVLCEDTAQFTRGLADVTGELTGSVVDALFYASRMQSYLGTHAYTLAIAAYIFAAGTLTTAIAPNFTRLVRKTQELEGGYKSSQETLKSTVEPVALLRGITHDEDNIRSAYSKLLRHTKKVLSAQWYSGVSTDFLLKYLGATAAVVLIIGPFFGRGGTANTTLSRAKMLSDMRYHTSMIIGTFAALGTLATSPRKWQKLRGFVARIAAMQRVLADVHDKAGDLEVHDAAHALRQEGSLRRIGSRVAAEQDEIAFEKVTVVTPAQTVLVRDLSVRVPAGTNLLVTGPNGSGKSSLFRVLGGLWPAESGVVRKPAASEDGLSNDIFYVPQRPYVTKGTLLGQLIYPLDASTHPNTLTAAQAESLLAEVDLDHLLHRHGLSSVVSWSEQLSLGEQQRLGIARLIFHKPRYAILDECTSGVTTDMEKRFTEILKRLGCTCITISHRPALVAFHDLVLALDGEGGWRLLPGHRQRASTGCELPQVVEEPDEEAEDAAEAPQTPPPGLDVRQRGEAAAAVTAAMEAGGGSAAAAAAAAQRAAAGRRVVASWLPRSGMTAVQASGDAANAAAMAQRLRAARAALPRGWPQWQRVLEALWSAAGLWTHARQLAAVGGIVLLRTLLQDRIARLNGRTVEYMLQQDYPAFQKLIVVSVLQSLGSAILAPTLKYATDALGLEWRKRLTTRALEHYLQGDTAYATQQLGGMADAEQRMTTDTKQLSGELAQLVPTFCKPLVDTLWFSVQMGMLTGARGLVFLYGYAIAGFVSLRILTPDFAALSSRAMALEAELRAAHSHLKQHAESVAFFGGAAREGANISRRLQDCLSQQGVVARSKWMHSTVDDLFTKQLPHNATWALTLLYALQRDDSAWVDAAAQGSTVYEMRYLATIVSNCFLAFGDLLQLQTRVRELSAAVARVSQVLLTAEASEDLQRECTAASISGAVLPAGEPPVLLDIQSLSIVTPTGATLAKHITLQVRRGQNLMITGPNGSGKTSIVRILRGLWPHTSGSIFVSGGPDAWRRLETVFYVPQQPYLSSSSLLEQIIYPLSVDGALELRGFPRGKLVGKADALRSMEEKCMELMHTVKLKYLVEREGGWRVAKHWSTRLSLGEQQRVGMARLFYHRPTIAVLDECTNATSVDVEELLFETSRDLGITLLTITQRPHLTHLYSQELRMLDGAGHWELCELHTSDGDGLGEDEEFGEDVKALAGRKGQSAGVLGPVNTKSGEDVAVLGVRSAST